MDDEWRKRVKIQDSWIFWIQKQVKEKDSVKPFLGPTLNHGYIHNIIIHHQLQYDPFQLTLPCILFWTPLEAGSKPKGLSWNDYSSSNKTPPLDFQNAEKKSTYVKISEILKASFDKLPLCPMSLSISCLVHLLWGATFAGQTSGIKVMQISLSISPDSGLTGSNAGDSKVQLLEKQLRVLWLVANGKSDMSFVHLTSPPKKKTWLLPSFQSSEVFFGPKKIR